MVGTAIGFRLKASICHARRSYSGLKQIQYRTCEATRYTSCQYPTGSQRRLQGSLSAARTRNNSHDRQHASKPGLSQATGWDIGKRYLSSSLPVQHTSALPSSSVSADEVSHFSRLASSWWDPHGPSRLLHLMNPLRHDFIRSCLATSTSNSTSTTPLTPQSYLDIGCGGGIFASSAARLQNTSSVTAIDPTPECIVVAQSHARRDPVLQPPKLIYHNCAIESLPSSIPPVSIITLFEVLEHIASPSSFLSTCIPHLQPGGWLIGSTIARSPLSYITTKLIAEAPLIGVVPAGTHDWNQYINPGELREWFATRAEGEGEWGDFRVQGVVYVPGFGWKTVPGSEEFGNYFFGVQKLS